MDEWGIDGEEYIAAIRAGAIDPFGHTAAQLQDELDDFDREWGERLAALSDDDTEAVVAGRMQVPHLSLEPESEYERQMRLEEEFVGRVKALHAQRSRLEAEERELLAARYQRVTEGPGDVATRLRAAASVLGAELRQSDRSIERRMADAWSTVTELPLAHAAHREGRISITHLRVIEHATHALRLDDTADSAERVRVEHELVAIAERTTPTRLRARSKRIVNRVLTEPLQQRHDAAREQRHVWMLDAGDGMVDFGGRVRAVAGVAIFDLLTQATRGKAKDDPRTFDHFRADAFCELLLTGQVPADLHGLNPIKPTVTITIPATELLRDGAQPDLRFPAALDGEILVDAATVRAIAAEAIIWERLFLHPVTGVPVAVDTYWPNRAQRRWLRHRDGRCRWPGCSNSVSYADADHTRAHADGGPTSIENLAYLCKRHHMMKHTTAWTVRQLGFGVLEWTSPLGKVYIDEPEPIAPRFVEPQKPDWGGPFSGDSRCSGTDPPWAHRRDCAGHPPAAVTTHPVP